MSNDDNYNDFKTELGDVLVLRPECMSCFSSQYQILRGKQHSDS
jgi:hypothetical protein